MENASKALLIAGAILLAVLIIGLGIYIYNQASNTVGDTGVDKLAARQFNSQFEPYLEKELDAVSAKALIDTIKTSNYPGSSGIKLLGIKSKKDIENGMIYVTEVEYQHGKISKILLKNINDVTSSLDNIDVGDEPQNNLSDDVLTFNRQFLGLVPTIYPNTPYSSLTLNLEKTFNLISVLEQAIQQRQITLIFEPQDDSRTVKGCIVYDVYFDGEGYINGLTGDYLYVQDEQGGQEEESAEEFNSRFERILDINFGYFDGHIDGEYQNVGVILDENGWTALWDLINETGNRVSVDMILDSPYAYDEEFEGYSIEKAYFDDNGYLCRLEAYCK